MSLNVSPYLSAAQGIWNGIGLSRTAQIVGWLSGEGLPIVLDPILRAGQEASKDAEAVLGEAFGKAVPEPLRTKAITCFDSVGKICASAPDLLPSVQKCCALARQIGYVLFATHFVNDDLQALGFLPLPHRVASLLVLTPILSLLAVKATSPGRLRSVLEKVQSAIEPLCVLAMIVSQVALVALQQNISAGFFLGAAALHALNEKKLLPSKISRFYEGMMPPLLIGSLVAILSNSPALGAITLVALKALVWIDRRRDVSIEHSGKLVAEDLAEMWKAQWTRDCFGVNFDHIHSSSLPLIAAELVDWERFEKLWDKHDFLPLAAKRWPREPREELDRCVRVRKGNFQKLIENNKKRKLDCRAICYLCFVATYLPDSSSDIQKKVLWILGDGPFAEEAFALLTTGREELPLRIAILHQLQVVRARLVSQNVGCRLRRIVTKKFWQITGLERERQSSLEAQGYDSGHIVHKVADMFSSKPDRVGKWWNEWLELDKQKNLSPDKKAEIKKQIEKWSSNLIMKLGELPLTSSNFIDKVIAPMLFEMGILNKKPPPPPGTPPEIAPAILPTPEAAERNALKARLQKIERDLSHFRFQGSSSQLDVDSYERQIAGIKARMSKTEAELAKMQASRPPAKAPEPKRAGELEGRPTSSSKADV